MTTTELLDKLFEEWRSKYSCYKNRFVKDGVVNEYSWHHDAKKKVLFLLKETNDKYYQKLPLDKRNLYRDDIRRMLDDKPWREIGYFGYGLQNTTSSYIPKFEAAKINVAEACKQSAVMNLKKLPGKESANENEIAKFAKRQKEEIEKEIRIICPDVIVLGGSGIGKIFKVLFHYKQLGERIYSFEVGDREFSTIDFVHPEARVSDDVLYYALVIIYQQGHVMRKL